ncbi:hypothetical protein HK102_002796 [Quaeritorhiza haematococci]|nr:hypothetical protein HK102_002796 [Quaeritorhiza haematococci]
MISISRNQGIDPLNLGRLVLTNDFPMLTKSKNSEMTYRLYLFDNLLLCLREVNSRELNIPRTLNPPDERAEVSKTEATSFSTALASEATKRPTSAPSSDKKTRKNRGKGEKRNRRESSLWRSFFLSTCGSTGLDKKTCDERKVYKSKSPKSRKGPIENETGEFVTAEEMKRTSSFGALFAKMRTSSNPRRASRQPLTMEAKDADQSQPSRSPTSSVHSDCSSILLDERPKSTATKTKEGWIRRRGRRYDNKSMSTSLETDKVEGNSSAKRDKGKGKDPAFTADVTNIELLLAEEDETQQHQVAIDRKGLSLAFQRLWRYCREGRRGLGSASKQPPRTTEETYPSKQCLLQEDDDAEDICVGVGDDEYSNELAPSADGVGGGESDKTITVPQLSMPPGFAETYGISPPAVDQPHASSSSSQVATTSTAPTSTIPSQPSIGASSSVSRVWNSRSPQEIPTPMSEPPSPTSLAWTTARPTSPSSPTSSPLSPPPPNAHSTPLSRFIIKGSIFTSSIIGLMDTSRPEMGWLVLKVFFKDCVPRDAVSVPGPGKRNLADGFPHFDVDHFLLRFGDAEKLELWKRELERLIAL